MTTPRPARVGFSLVTLLVLLSLGCKQEAEAQTAGYQPGQPQYGSPGYGQGGMAGSPAMPPPGYGQAGTPATAPAPGQPAPAPTAPAPGSPSPSPASSPSAQPIDPAAASVAAPFLHQLATAHTVPGARPLGSLLAGMFQTGQVLEAQIQLQPGKCYTVVGTGLAPVAELDVSLVMTVPIPNVQPVLATDSDTGPTAVVGKKPNCYGWPFPLAAPVKVVLRVTSGSGLAAAQVYEK